ncbi:MAG: FtsX-like permease family protein [Acidobacteriota bacterium]
MVRHVKHRGLDVQGREQVYFPLGQQPDDTAFMFLALRGSGDPTSLAGLLRRTVGSLDPDLPLASLKAMDERVALSLAQPRLLTLLVGLFAVLGLSLAAMGIYGIISYSVQSRRREIGLRMALGAQSGQVFSMVVKRAMGLTGAGLLVGLVASLGLGGYISSLLFQVEPHDPFTLAGCALFLALIALAACSLPARSAARTDPIQTLRTE